MENQTSLREQNNHKLIVALDNLSEAEAKAKIEQISVECA
jgi:hypothetical protein